jgi:hypothetical protein
MVVKTIQNNLINGHRWTPEELDLIRVEYKGTLKSAEIIAKRISALTGDTISSQAVKKQAVNNGLTTRRCKIWDDKELEYFIKLIGKYSMKDMLRKMKAAGYKRTMKSLDAKLSELNMKADDRDGWYTKVEVCEILGVGRETVQKWIDSKSLKATYHHGVEPTKDCGRAYWHIEESDLRDFIIKHSMDLTGRNVDLFQIVTILMSDRER